MAKALPIPAEAYLAAIVDSSDDAIISTDLTGTITSWNPAAERLFGFSAAEVVGRPVTSIVPPEHAAGAERLLKQVMDGSRIEQFETVQHDKSGRPIEISLIVSPIRDATGTTIGVSRIARDIRDRKRAEMAALRLAAIVDSSDDAIVSKDLNGIVTSWNAAAERLFGFSAAEMIGQPIAIIIPRDRLEEEKQVLERVRAGSRVDHFDTVRRTKDGALIDISLTVSPVCNAAGRVIGASKIARDITEHKRLLEAERRAEARDEAARRELLEAENRRIQEASRVKTEFVANMSHELRTPLNSLIGFAELIAEERFGPHSPKYPQFARTMLGSARHLLGLINDILDLAKVESGKIDLRPTRVELPAVIHETRSTVAGLAGQKRISVDVEIDETIAAVYLDPGRLKQVLYNYLSNAIKFSPAGGRVLLRAVPDGDAAFRIEVVDNGIGIKAEDSDRLFVEFQQLNGGSNKQYRGTGLGLALTKRIVEAQGGRVGFQSTFGSGSTFFVTLPKHASARSADVTSQSDDVSERTIERTSEGGTDAR